MEYYLTVLILVTAFLYSSVGHGGASGYLALMSIFSIAPEYMKTTALVLNLFVASISFIMYYRGGHFRWKILVPLIITSIPAAYLGALFDINPKIYKIILGICLLFAIFRMVYKPKEQTEKEKKTPRIWILLLTGAFLGFFSGMIGIGGGIILSPILLLANWSNIKETAGISALFILVNSASGLIGHVQHGIHLPSYIYLWILAGILGGIAGGYFGSYKFSLTGLKYLLASVLGFASIKLFLF